MTRAASPMQVRLWYKYECFYGQDGLSHLIPDPMNVDAISLTQIACGDNHAAALSSSGEVFTWGKATSGALGHGCPGSRDIHSPDYFSVGEPTKVEALSGETIVKVACGHSYTVAVTATGKLFVW